jgi:hypothetical protein
MALCTQIYLQMNRVDKAEQQVKVGLAAPQRACVHADCL